MRRRISIIILAISIGLAGTAVESLSAKDALDLVNGTWATRSKDDARKTTTTPCETAPRYEASADRQTVTISRPKDGQYEISTTYLVMAVEEKRALMFIKGERRLTDNGDPAVWWIMFEDENRFQWRRTDWKPELRTAAEWVRCP